MKSILRHSLVAAAVRSGSAVMSKSASATPAQAEILNAAWPQESEGLTKKAELSRVIASGMLVEEAEASLEAPATV